MRSVTGHEARVLVVLPIAVEQGVAWIGCEQISPDPDACFYDYHNLMNTAQPGASNRCQLEVVPVQMHRMIVHASIVEVQRMP
jgi:hypothetical protein